MGGRMSAAYYQAYHQKHKVRRTKLHREWIKRNMQQSKTYHAGYYRKNWVKMALKRAHSRARSQGLMFALVEQDIVVPALCPVLSIPIIVGGKSGGPNSPSLDRHVNELGYTRENVRVISKRANTIKNDATVLELEAVLRYMKGAV